MSAQAPTRERLLTAAMQLFSERGFDATSVAQIEAAAGLAVGSGALYRHFKSKVALLDAGIDRQLDRRHAMRDIRSIFAGLGDPHTELTILGRYLLTVIDDETELLHIAVRTTAQRSSKLTQAYTALINGIETELAEWISTWAPNSTPEQARTIATLGISGLLGHRLGYALVPEHAITDDQYLSEWTTSLNVRVQMLG